MLIDILSDLHLDIQRTPEEVNQFFGDLVRYSGSNTLFLAGDLAECHDYRYDKWLQRLSCHYKDIYLTAGNHSFWNSSIPETNKRLKQLTDKYYINLVEPGKVFQLGEYKVMGGTLWFNDTNPYNGWIDYYRIKDGLTDIPAEYRAFCEKVLPIIDDKTIVLSHHFPTSESIDPMYRGEPNNIYFCAYIQDKIIKAPRVWLHGHTHVGFEYTSALGFKVYCNPMGYNGEGANKNFWDRLTIDI
jgi:predicted phosphohydrolase